MKLHNKQKEQIPNGTAITKVSSTDDGYVYVSYIKNGKKVYTYIKKSDWESSKTQETSNKNQSGNKEVANVDTSGVNPNKNTGKDLRKLVKDAVLYQKKDNNLQITTQNLKKGDGVQYLGIEVIGLKEYAKIIYTFQTAEWHGYETHNVTGYIELSALGISDGWTTKNDTVYFNKAKFTVKVPTLKRQNGSNIETIKISSFDTPLIRIAVNNRLGLSKIKYNGKEYFAESSELTTVKPNNTTNGNSTSNGPTFKNVNETVYATTNVNIRKSWDANSEKIGTLSKGQSITRTGIGSNGWDKVNYNGTTAYISSSYLTTTKCVKKQAFQLVFSCISCYNDK